LCHGETTLPRRRHQHPALALAALAAAFVQVPTDARAQSPSPSPFQPSLTDPRNVQRFKTSDPTTRATAAEILPPSGAGETGFDSTGAIRKKKKVKKKAGEPHPLPPPPLESNRGSAPQLKIRKSYAEAYKPPDAPVRRIAPVLQDAFEPVGVRVGSFLLKPSIEITRGYNSNPAHTPTGKPSAFTLVEPALKVQSEWARHELRAELRGSLSRYDSNPTLNSPLIDAKAFLRLDVTRDTKINSESRFYLSTDYPGSPNLPADIAKLPIFTSYGNNCTPRRATIGPRTRIPSSPTARPRATAIAILPNMARRCGQATRCFRVSGRSPSSAPTRASTICNSTATTTRGTPRRSHPRSARPLN
jgi:hypothetical protein